MLDFLVSYFTYRKACRTKQESRQAQISALPALFKSPISAKDKHILSLPIAEIANGVKAGVLDPQDVVVAYSKASIIAQQRLNCLTEVMVDEAYHKWSREVDKNGPLAGVCVSFKDTVGVQGYDSTIGYSRWVNRPMQKNAALTSLLLAAGAVPYVKTTIPVTLLSFESISDVFGGPSNPTLNPHSRHHSPGGSTGGEAALLAFGGSRIGIGTDVAGSVRCPSHYSGVYTIKCSVGRFPKWGSATSIPGQEGVAPVYSPMARTLEDLEYFWKAVSQMEPWRWDHTCLDMPWKEASLSEKKLRWGVMWDDGVVKPSPACQRALQTVVDVLKKHGHDVFDFNPPSPYEGLKIASQLLCADACKTATAPIVWPWEFNDTGIKQALGMFGIPHVFRKLYTWYWRYIRRDEVYAGLVEGWHEKSISEYWALVAHRESYRRDWWEAWNGTTPAILTTEKQDPVLVSPNITPQDRDPGEGKRMDFLLTVPNALPAVPHGGMKDGWRACGYTFLFNLLDYSAGVLPVTHLSPILDALAPGMKARNHIEATTYRMYNPISMTGLPIGVQVVGRRLEEEKVLGGMKIIESLLNQEGLAYKRLDGIKVGDTM